jgi:putative transcriptional regulator
MKTKKSTTKRNSAAKTSKATRAVSSKRGRASSKSRISEVVHETARDLFAAGAISRATMREFDALSVPKVPAYTPKQIKAIREHCSVSQAIFAICMNTSTSALQKWETGARRPDAIALKLLSLVERKGLDALL